MDFNGWKAMGENQWVVRYGILTSPHSGANLVSEQEFTDLKLHVEFRYQEGSKSGVYLRGRYEVQIEDSPANANPLNILFSEIYRFLPPCNIAHLGPDTWKTFGITQTGRLNNAV